MSDEHARDKVDGVEIFVGDTVMVSGEVVRSVAGVGALVQFTSKTENYQGWIREDDLWFAALTPDLAPEPGDGVWLLVHDEEGVAQIFHRDDAEGHCDHPTRRYDRHWWDVVATQWIDWPTAVLRGAGRRDVQRMRVEGEGE